MVYPVHVFFLARLHAQHDAGVFVVRVEEGKEGAYGDQGCDTVHRSYRPGHGAGAAPHPRHKRTAAVPVLPDRSAQDPDL